MAYLRLSLSLRLQPRHARNDYTAVRVLRVRFWFLPARMFHPSSSHYCIDLACQGPDHYPVMLLAPNIRLLLLLLRIAVFPLVSCSKQDDR